MSDEQWLPVTVNADYEVSNHGRVRSLDRVILRVNRWGETIPFNWRGRIMKNILHHTGYYITKFGGDKKQYRVHQLVAWAFLGPQGDLVVNHLNGVKIDNRPENLEYITDSANVKHAYATGLLSNRGESNGRALLTEAQVAEIKAGMDTEDACKRFNVRPYVIQRIKSGLRWGHVAPATQHSEV